MRSTGAGSMLLRLERLGVVAAVAAVDAGPQPTGYLAQLSSPRCSLAGSWTPLSTPSIRRLGLRVQCRSWTGSQPATASSNVVPTPTAELASTG